jgi:hypothetical protein
MGLVDFRIIKIFKWDREKNRVDWKISIGKIQFFFLNMYVGEKVESLLELLITVLMVMKVVWIPKKGKKEIVKHCS